jgi:hypothetical protein
MKKGKIASKDADNLVDILFDLKSVVGLKKKMQTLSKRGITLVHQIGNRKTNELLVTLAKSMLEDL